MRTMIVAVAPKVVVMLFMGCVMVIPCRAKATAGAEASKIPASSPVQVPVSDYTQVEHSFSAISAISMSSRNFVTLENEAESEYGKGGTKLWLESQQGSFDEVVSISFSKEDRVEQQQRGHKVGRQRQRYRRILNSMISPASKAIDEGGRLSQLETTRNTAELKSLSSTFDSDGESYGMMFTIQNINAEGKEVLIDALSIHLNIPAGSTTPVLIYSVGGRYSALGSAAEKKGSWGDPVCNSTAITAAGGGMPSYVPSTEFGSVAIASGAESSFYVTLPTEDIRYTAAPAVGNTEEGGTDLTFDSEYIRNEDVALLVGSSVTEFPFGGRSSIPAIFNGVIIYSLQDAGAVKQGQAGGSTAATSAAGAALEGISETVAATTAALVTTAPTPAPQPTGAPISLAPTAPWVLTYNDKKDERTTFLDGNGGYGIFFSVKAVRRGMAITTLDFHTDKEGKILNVDVYLLRGDYRGYEKVESAWERICHTRVVGKAQMDPTPIPDDAFRSVRLERDEVVSFYLTLTTEDLRYSNSNEDVNTVFVRTYDMELYVGKGVGGAGGFSTTKQEFDSRVFNGVIHFEGSTDDPEEIVLLPDPEAYKYEEKLVSTFEGGAGGSGAMFQMEAKSPIIITGMDAHIDMDYETRIEVWTKAGTFVGSENDRTVWTRVAETAVMGQGVGEGTPVRGGFDPPVVMEVGETRSFYVTIPRTNMRYTKGTDDQPIGTLYKENKDLKFYVGAGIVYPFGRDYPPRIYNGNIQYKVKELPVPTATPTAAPAVPVLFTQAPYSRSPLEELAQVQISLEGKFARRLLQEMKERGLKSARELPPNSIKSFQSQAAKHVEKFGKKYSLKVKGAYVSFPAGNEIKPGGRPKPRGRERSVMELAWGPQKRGEEGNDESRRWPLSTSLSPWFASWSPAWASPPSFSYSLVPHSLRRMLQGDVEKNNEADDENPNGDTLDMYTTLVAEYTPPPVLDFGPLTEDSFNDEGEAFVRELKGADQEYEEVTSVSAREVTFPLPAELKGLEPKTEPDFDKSYQYLKAVYSVCGILAFLLIVALVAVAVIKKRKRDMALRGEVPSVGKNLGDGEEGHNLTEVEGELEPDDGDSLVSYEDQRGRTPGRGLPAQ